MEFTNVCTVIYLLAALHLAHRALVAALIFANPAAEIRRLPALIGTTLWPFAFAQRASVQQRSSLAPMRSSCEVSVIRPCDLIRPVLRWQYPAHSIVQQSSLSLLSIAR